MEELIEISKKYDCVMSAAHPFGYASRGMVNDLFSEHNELFDKIGNFEAINGGNDRKQNMKSVEYLEAHSKGFTGGTDGHSIYPLGNIVTSAKAKDCKNFLDKIRKKENLVTGIESSLGKIGEYGRFWINKINNLLKK